MVSVDQVAQEAVLPADIMFSLRSPPSAGYLVMVSHGASADEPPSLDPVQSFSQEAVNSGRVLYLHSRPGAWSDSFSLDVTSGLGDPLEGIFVELEVLPTVIPLEGQNFSVPEGGTRTLAPPLLQITGPYFPTLPGLLLQVLEPPQHGALQKEDQPRDGSLSTFSWREVCLFQRPQGRSPALVAATILCFISRLSLGAGNHCSLPSYLWKWVLKGSVFSCTQRQNIEGAGKS